MQLSDLITCFRRQVDLHSTVIAIQDDSFALTYSELERWSNNLAYEVHSRLKINRGSGTVAICMPRSVLNVVSILAVVKAGFSYLPLDPCTPPARLDDQLLQSDARLLLSMPESQLPPLGRAIPFNIVPFIDRTCVRDHTELPSLDREIANDILAVLFTSGSTGRPKGVLILHSSMMNVVNSRFLEIQPGDHVSMTANPTFDASAHDIWGTLCHGGTLFALTAHLADIKAVATFFRKNAINKTFLPTAVFHRIASDSNSSISLGITLRMILVGEEPLSTASVKSFLRFAPTTRLVNIYGPTETTFCSTTFEVPPNIFEDDHYASRPIPVGRCIPNTTLFILDDNLRPVHGGFPGEICIGGAGLAAGYLGQAQATSSKFVMVNDLEGDGSSTRLYRTGDIGKFIPSTDGFLLEFIGRGDSQIKIRGQRVEPTEIEAVLRAGPDGIEEAVVVATEDDQLIAYVVQKDGAGFDGISGHTGQPAGASTKSLDVYHTQREWEKIDPATAGADFTGWVSMFDGVPIPQSEMQDWLSDTIRSIPVKQSDCVLEIGCGTGMVLFALEPYCQEYFGVDMFGPALAFVRARLIERGLEDKVTLFQGVADELAELLPKEKRFDLVIVNSVVQHFPSSKYFENVLKLCIDILRDGGRILLGDLRGLGVDKHHDLARVLHCDPSPELLTSEIQERLDRSQRRQTELKVNPSFFFRVQNNHESRISHIEVSPKMMVSHNELSQFRYQAILHIGTPTPTLTVPDRWTEYTTLDYLEDVLSSGRNDVVAIRSIPNSLVGVEQGILQLLSLPQPPSTASELIRAATTSDHYLRALSPMDIAALSERHGYQVDISIKALGIDQSLAAVFSRCSSPVKGDFSAIALDDEPTNALVDHVAAPSYVQDLTSRLLDRCREKLPLYMVPRCVIIQRSLPLTENGKVDRRMLAHPHMWTKSLSFGAPSETYHPENEMQAQVQDCIARALDILPAKVPLRTDFGALGLHSFRAPKFLNDLRAQFAIPDLPLKIIHKHATVAALSSYLEGEIRLTPSAREPRVLAGATGRREVPYDHEALQEVLRSRRMTANDVEDIYETTLAQRLLLMGHSRRSFMMHQVVIAHTDIDTLIQAIDVVVSRHTVLRSTVFDKLRRQVVFRHSPKLRDEMLHIYPAEDAQSLSTIIQDDTRYALTVPGNLINFELFVTEPPTLLILVHHALMDSWSRDCLLNDIDRVITGQQLPESVPFRTYVDYVIAEGNRPDDIAWHADRIRTADIIGFPSCDAKSTFSSSSCLGPDFVYAEELFGLANLTQDYGIKASTLLKVAFALVKRHESKQDTVLIPQAEACRNLPIKGITDICAPTYNIAIDRIDFLPNDTVLDLLRRTQSNQDKMTDTCAVDYEAVLAAVEKDLTPFSSSSYNFVSLQGRPSYKVLQLGPAGAENDLGLEWTTIVDGEHVKVRGDCDPIFSDRIEAYVRQFFTAARWLLSNINARSLAELHLDG